MVLMATEKTPAVMGRPGLKDHEKALVVRTLSALTPKTREYRKARRALATMFDRGELAIDVVFKNEMARLAAADSSSSTTDGEQPEA